MIHDLSETVKHWLDLGAFTGAVVSVVTLANATLLMSFLAAFCSVLWFGVRMYDRVKYGHDGDD